MALGLELSRDTLAAFFMSTSVCTKVVGLRHWWAPGTVAALAAAGPSQSGARASRSSPKWPTASLAWVIMT